MIVSNAANYKKERKYGKHESDLHLHPDSGYKLQYVASVLHISSNTPAAQVVGETQFKLDEAERLSTMLGLTMAERDACFFSMPRTRFSRAVQRPGAAQKGEAPVTPEQRDDPETPCAWRAPLGARRKPPPAKRH